jgi:hypothetical protein
MKSRSQNARHKQNEDMEAAAEECASCGMPKGRWTANEGQGIAKNNEFYCCEGCADDTGCTCSEDSQSDESMARMEEEPRSSGRQGRH